MIGVAILLWLLGICGALRVCRDIDRAEPFTRGEYFAVLAACIVWPATLALSVALVIVLLVVNGVWEAL